MRLTFEQFLNLVDDTHNQHPFELRYGQTVMNTLLDVWPEKYRDYIKTELDCFYDDGVVKSTLDHLKYEWDK
jgi:hypothetical protein